MAVLRLQMLGADSRRGPVSSSIGGLDFIGPITEGRGLKNEQPNGVADAHPNVCFQGQSGNALDFVECPLMTQAV